ncbi:MAG: rhomboid family intramembrane serine protease [Gammaproteobacteria bacterium]
MFFLPLRMDFAVFKLPLLTFLVTLICIGVYFAQRSSDASLLRKIENYCEFHETETIDAIQRLSGTSNDVSCKDTLQFLLHNKDWRQKLDALAEHRKIAVPNAISGQSDDAVSTLVQTRDNFVHDYKPHTVTEKLVYIPGSWNPLTMVSAALAHGGFIHLFGNLLFYFIFGSVVEAVLGYRRYAALLLLLALGTHTLYSLAMLSKAPIPTLGLSGVVYGVMGVFLFFMPSARVQVLVWFFTRIFVTTVPAWLFIGFYIGSDTWTLFREGQGGGVNLIAHVSGAVIGFALAASVFRKRKELVELSL